MGEAAVKEPSMEDILSSIRKIISEEGNKPEVEQSAPVAQVVEPEVAFEPSSSGQMADVLEEIRTVEPEPEPVVANFVDTQTTGNEAAKMAASLANIAQTVKAEEPEELEMIEPSAPAQRIWDDVAETNLVEEHVAEPMEAVPSFASIAETVTEQVKIPVVEEIENVEMAQEPEVHHVEMAEATPAPVSETTVQSVVEEEMAFRGALMSPSSDGAVSGAFDRLKRSAMDDIDAKTEAILRPMLREWLDENLPNMVERLVREEIERVARGV